MVLNLGLALAMIVAGLALAGPALLGTAAAASAAPGVTVSACAIGKVRV